MQTTGHLARRDAELNSQAAIDRPHRVGCALNLQRAGSLSARTEPGSRRLFHRLLWLTFLSLFVLSLLLLTSNTLQAQQTDFPQPSWNDHITVSADRASRWQQGSYDCWLLTGNVYLNQGPVTTRGQSAVLFVEPANKYTNEPTKIIAYFEDRVALDYRYPDEIGKRWGNKAAHLEDKSWFGRFYTLAPLQFRVPQSGPEPQQKPPVFERGLARLDPNFARSVQQAAHLQVADEEETDQPVMTAGLQQPIEPEAGAVQQAQFTEFAPGPALTDPLPTGMRRLRAFPRSDVRIQAQWFPSAGGNEWVAVISSGINLIIDGLDDGRSVDIAADRMVIWTAGVQPDLTGAALESADRPLEIYMEGNIVFREGDRVITADRMFYDATRKLGVILDAELLTPVQDYVGLLRLKANIIRQLDPDHFVAFDGLLTTSRMGEPRYFFSSDAITFTDQQMPAFDPMTGAPVIDPLTGEQVVQHERLAESRNNFLRVGGVPILYWPTMATDLEDPRFYIDSAAIKNDNIFGTQLSASFDAYQILGIKHPPKGSEWKFDADYFSERGPGGGTRYQYDQGMFLGFAGRTRGKVDVWGIYDTGLDNLGRGRRALVPDTEYRGRARWEHRQNLASGYQVKAEVGWISDRNFLEQYYENVWDNQKDQSTGLEIKRILDNQSYALSVDARLNGFFTQTEWLPRLDHFWLGQSLLGDRITWYEHTSIGYAQFKTASPPTDPAEIALTNPLAWETTPTGVRIPERSGERIATRHELDLPIQVGVVKVVPYVLGELAHWGEDLAGNDLQRAYVNTGARASIPFWSVDPTVKNRLLNLDGLAHKIVWDAEVSYSDASQNVEELPLYDQLDDDNIEAFRRRMFVTTYGSVPNQLGLPQAPLQFDERLYAVRSGMGNWVTAPSTEVVDDLLAVRTGVRQRWQTKRGRPGEQRIVDWIVFDTNATWFPKEEENFGEPIGLVDYDFRWHLGDRFTLLSNGVFDFFTDGGKMVNVGGFLNRPPRGSLYMGFTSYDGPFTSNVFTTALGYQLSPKWISNYSASIDLNDADNVSHSLLFTRVGESLLVRLGFVVNESKDAFGVNLMIEPRFLPKGELAKGTGVQIPPAGAFGLE